MPLVFCVLLCLAGCDKPAHPPTPVLDEAVRKEVYFQIDQDRPLRLEASPKLTELRLVSTIEADPNALVDEYLYGIRVRVLRGNDTIWDRTYYERTRLSQLKAPDGQPLLDIRDPSDDVTVTDRRVTDIFLGNAMEEGDYVELSLVASLSQRGFVRAYQKELRSLEDVEKEWKRMSDDERKERMAVSAVPPSMLNDRELFQLLRKTYRTIPPEGVNGRDYVGRKFILREEPISYRDYLYGDQTAEFTVGGGGQMAINLCGKGVLRFAFPGYAPAAGPARKAVVRVVNERSGQASFVRPVAFSDGEYRIEIPTREGCCSLILDYPYPEKTAVRASFLEQGAENRPENWREQVPNYISTRAYLCRPLFDSTTAPKPIFSNIPKGQQFIVVRSMLAVGPDTLPPKTYTYHYAFLDPDQTILSEGDLHPETAPAALTRFPAGGNLATMNPTEPHQAYFAVLPGAASLSIISEDPVLFGFMTTSAPRDLIEKRIPEDKKQEIVNRDDVDYEPQWFHTRPVDHQQLEINGLSTSVLTQQVQIVMTPNPLPVDDTRGLALFPRQADSRIAVMETARVDPRLGGADSQAWYRPLHPGFETVLSVPTQAYGAKPPETEMVYQCPARPDQSPTLRIDDQPVGILSNSNTLIKTHALELEPGERKISLTGCPTGLGFIRLPGPPDPGDEVAREHGYFRLMRGTDMEAPFRKPGGDPVSINLAFYSNDGSPGRAVVEARIFPEDRLASYAEEPPPYRMRKFSINPSGPDRGACMHFTGCRLGAKQTLAIPLNSWYPPGDYRLSLRLAEGTKALVRFFIYSRPEQADPLRAFYRE